MQGVERLSVALKLSAFEPVAATGVPTDPRLPLSPLSPLSPLAPSPC